MFNKLSRRVKSILIIQVLCMLVGTSTHVLWVINHGFTYFDPRFSRYTTIFWNSLTFLDPLAAILLLASPKKGVLLTAVIIVTDVVHNAFVANLILPFSQTTWHDWFYQHQFLVLQGIFCILVLSTLKLNLNEIKAKQIG